MVWILLFKSIKSELFHLPVRKWCLRLLLRADVISHEREVSIRWDERQDTLRLPAPEPHAWVETHVIKKPRILSSTVRSVTKAKHWQLGIKDWEEVTPTIKDIVRSGIPLSFTQASITPWISADTVVPGKGGAINLTYETLHEEKGLIHHYNMFWWNKCQFVPDLSTIASISSVTSKYASLLAYLTPARLHGMLDSWPCGNVSPTLLPPEKETKPRWSHKCTH